MRIIVKCAWCGITMKVKESEGEQAELISHSICASCKKKVSEEIESIGIMLEQKKTHPFNPSKD